MRDLNCQRQIYCRWLVPALLVMLTACGTPAEKSAGYLEEALAFYDEGNLVKAKLSVRNSLQIDPKNPRARFLYASLLEAEQDVRGAVGNLQLAVDEDPDYLDARIKLAGYFVVGRGMEQAREQIDAALGLAPEDPRVRLLHARLLLLEGKQDAALAEAELASSLDPTRADVAGFTALLYARSGNLDAGLQLLERSIELGDAESKEYLRNARISILAEVGERDLGLAAVEAMVRDYPEQASYQMALAELYVDRGQTAEAEELIEALIARDPDNAQWRIRLAQLLAGTERIEDAETELLAASEADRDSMELRFALGALYESAGRRDEAIGVYQSVAAAAASTSERLAAKNRIAALSAGADDDLAQALIGEILQEAPDNTDALLARAAYRIRDGDNDAAIGDLRAALARQPDSARALLGLARAHVINGNAVLAEENYRRLLALQPANAPALRELGVLLGNRGDLAEAETLLREALRQGENDSEASRNLVKALLQQQDYKSAAQEAGRMAALGEPTGMADYQLGLALEAQGQPAEAEAAYLRALSKSPRADEPLVRLIALYGRTAQPQAAENFLETHLQGHPEHLRARLLLAEVYAVNGAADRAEDLYRQVISDEPAALGAYAGLAGMAPELSDARLAALQAGFSANPDSAELALALGASYQRRGDYEQAISTYEKLLAARDNDLVASNLAALLLDQRDDAVSRQRALQLAGRFANGDQHPFSHGVLGWALYYDGQFPRAVRYLEQAVAAAPQVPQLHYFLGMAYLGAENEASARQHLDLAITGAEQAGSSFTGLDQAVAARGRLSGSK